MSPAAGLLDDEVDAIFLPLNPKVYMAVAALRTGEAACHMSLVVKSRYWRGLEKEKKGKGKPTEMHAAQPLI